jgi:hypothetical protein
LNFQASEFEFRKRFWFFAGIFSLDFFLYSVDHLNASVALSRLIFGPEGAHSPLLDRYLLLYLLYLLCLLYFLCFLSSFPRMFETPPLFQMMFSSPSRGATLFAGEGEELLVPLKATARPGILYPLSSRIHPRNQEL